MGRSSVAKIQCELEPLNNTVAGVRGVVAPSEQASGT